MYNVHMKRYSVTDARQKIADLLNAAEAGETVVIELHFLVEVARVTLRAGTRVTDLLEDDRWLVDDPPSATWFERASVEGWTRDPFDRLLVAHARLRGWRFATADNIVIQNLSRA